MRDFAQVWQAADKIVYSTTLETAATSRTCIARTFDPDAVRQLRASADHDIAVSGPTLAQHAFTAGLVDECHLYLVPVLVGGGTPCLPRHVRRTLDLRNVSRWTRFHNQHSPVPRAMPMGRIPRRLARAHSIGKMERPRNGRPSTTRFDQRCRTKHNKALRLKTQPTGFGRVLASRTRSPKARRCYGSKLLARRSA